MSGARADHELQVNAIDPSDECVRARSTGLVTGDVMALNREHDRIPAVCREVTVHDQEAPGGQFGVQVQVLLARDSEVSDGLDQGGQDRSM